MYLTVEWKRQTLEQLIIRLEVPGIRNREKKQPNHQSQGSLDFFREERQLSICQIILAKETPSISHQAKKLFSEFTDANRYKQQQCRAACFRPGHLQYFLKSTEGIPWWSSGLRHELSLPWAQVQSPVGELRSRKPRGAAKKKSRK